MMLATREMVSPIVPRLSATAPRGVNDTANAVAATAPSTKYRTPSTNAVPNASPTTPNASAKSPTGEMISPTTRPMPPMTTPTTSKAVPRPASTGCSTSPIGPTIALMPPKNSAEPWAMPSPRPTNGSRSSSPSRELATPRASMPAPKSSILPRSMAVSDPPSRSMSLAAGPSCAKNGSRSAPLLPKICMAAAVRLAGSSIPCSFSPTSRICSSGLRLSRSANETPSFARDSVAALLSSSAPASVFCSLPNALLTDSIETPERFPASSNN